MKNLIKGTAFFILAITFAACQQASDPVSPVSMDKNSVQLSTEPGTGTATGTFEITFPDSRASDQKGSITGSISFKFDDAASVYKYEGRLDTPSEDIHSVTFENTGVFERKGAYIRLTDNPATVINPGTQSLFLNGYYHYTVMGSRTIIEGDTRIGHLKIILY